VRESVSKELEKLRVDGAIGSSLAAVVNVYCEGSLAKKLAGLGDELRFVFITSDAKVCELSEKPAEAVEAVCAGEKFWIEVRASSHEKCERCWHHRSNVGNHAVHPTLCGRCVENVDGVGEVRRFT